MPRDLRAMAEANTSTEGQRSCARAQWCAGRMVTVINGERIVTPALSPRAFCPHDWDLIGHCLSDLPGIYDRLQAEMAEPAVTETHVHVPFGPSVPVRLDVDAAMRLIASRLAIWASRVRASARLVTRDAPAHSPEAVSLAADTLAKNLSVLLALQPGWMTLNVPLRPGRHGQPASFSAEVIEEHGDAEIVRVGADFAGLFVQRGGEAAGLEFLHLHYFGRAVLRETPARPEELLGVECRADGCGLLALRRADPAWFSGDPDYYAECSVCGALYTEDEYRHWVGQLHAYEKARLAAHPVLGETPQMPHLAGGLAGYGGKA